MLSDLKTRLAGDQSAAAEALTASIRLEVFRLSSRTQIRHGIGTVIWSMTLFVVAFYGASWLIPISPDETWLHAARGTIAGLVAVGGGYVALDIDVRRRRQQLIRSWDRRVPDPAG